MGWVLLNSLTEDEGRWKIWSHLQETKGIVIEYREINHFPS